ncbi:leucine-rich repeat-containing protein 43-like isoform X1 [Biomphalaria glabrata]|uniref:Leucine-rich repeat-containing protein 43-like isoform X1 n=1 Tax=Biomphalaria glabrata TaxID=6526 RepID=A0A9U8E0C5_BIOGL|nr:leucine-rich repeat-containing protein 43-like isoform X1 [Biomphalaria glabrata]XP_013068197.2 leucine-rich repeat-containing protein 43-like isoform X1 [Biomphalaria glabrata]XP_013068199.2 leucine-rich repeat-containing protein 43-like isoform X1 [Biomphalaria glabrata]XP_055861658.1 leucine-rich repeat-containing protein 43-like isoform X1 [Biomphalaria glabrata]
MIESQSAESQIVFSPVTAFEAIERQIKSLCLKDFPCGEGSWREERIINKLPTKNLGKSKNPKLVKKKDPYIVDSADKESVEVLQELIRSELSPWHLESSWSAEAEKLRRVAVQTPWLLKEETIFSYLKTVKIYDQGVVTVDKKLLKLKNLEELILSANSISSISSENLPKSLKKLELHANQISDISGLCISPPPLEHLGLGRNILTSIDEHITGACWPYLVSLDISHNDLCDLVKIISVLETLTKLRHLVMNGNPLSLIPAYRGFTIDSLKHLMVFDDIHLSVDEKLSFNKLARAKDTIIEEAQIYIEIPSIKGIPCPDEIKFKDTQPEYPVVDRKYFLQFMFLEEKVKTTSVIILEAAEQLKLMVTESQETDGVQELTADGLTSDKQNEVLLENKQSEYYAEPIELMPIGDEANKEEIHQIVSLSCCKLFCEATPESHLRLVPIKTNTFSWAPEQSLNIAVDIKRQNLLPLRDFFKHGMDFSLMEQLVVSYPTGHEAKEDKGGKGKDKSKSAKREKTPEKPKSAQKKEPKKKKDDVDLLKSKPVLATIASFYLPLENFLDGEYVCKNVFTAEELPAPLPAVPVEQDKINAKTKEKRKDSASPSDKNKNAKKTPTKEDKKKKHSEEPIDFGSERLELEVIVKLEHWMSTKDAYSEEKTQRVTQDSQGYHLI